MIMKKIFCMALLAALAILTSQVHAQAARVGDFTLIDHEGYAHQMSKYRYQNAVVIISHASNCRMSQDNVTLYKVLRTNWDHQGVSFFMLNASTEDNRETINQNEDVYNYDMPILLDPAQLIAESLGISKAGEIVVVDPRRMTILFRGPLDKRRTQAGAGTTDLNDALASAIGSDTRDLVTKIVDVEAAQGCELAFPARDQHAQNVPDYETEIAPILIERCVGCHVEGGIGPFAMNSHQMIQGWSPMIREVVMTRRMPPAQVDPDVRHYLNARNMPVEETQKLIHWINAGSPR
jgi:hypothetical protein